MADDAARSPRPPGRPKAHEPGVRVGTWLPPRIYDQLARQALKHDRSISSLVRMAIVRAVTPRPSPPES